MSGARILVVDDDPGILRSLRRSLEGYGYTVRALERGAEVPADVQAFHPEVVLLDLVLPDCDGIAVCSAIRQFSAVPVIILSAVGEDDRKVRALDAGADDYLTKPFSIPELQARIRVALRRAAYQASAPALEAGPVSLNLATHEVRVSGQPVHLTPREYDLLRVLVQERGRLLTARHLLSEVWGAGYEEDTHILRTFVHQLRAKLASADPTAALMLMNDPGVGYRFEAGPAANPADLHTQS